MGATAAVAMVGGGLMSAYNQYETGKANQRLSQFNARINEYQADVAIERGRGDERIMRERTRKTIGSQRARFAAQGVDVNDGSALEIQEATAAMGELDALTIRNNAAREAWGFRVGATNDRMRGSMQRADGTGSAVGTILTSGASAIHMRYGRGRD